MAIPESQLETWSHQGSKTQSAQTYAEIKSVLEDRNAPYADLNFDVFLQGSYRNDTNIRSDSDVDIVICLTSAYFGDTSLLPINEKVEYQRNYIRSSYGFQDFQIHVLSWLTKHFGSNVRLGNKAIFVPGNHGRRDTDVLVCVAYYRYISYQPKPIHCKPGICFLTKDGRRIINFPKQHGKNCTAKNQETSDRFKPNVRVLKNLRDAMIKEGELPANTAPSYFLEGMLWNVPKDEFASSYRDTFANYFYWLVNCDPRALKCANGLDPLIKSGADESWNIEDFLKFLKAAGRYWG